jgi:hypothetical protein
MSIFKNDGLMVQEYVYDFAVDGGVAAANIELSAKEGYNRLPIGAIIKGVTAKVVTAVVGTSSTVAWGHSANPDAYSGTTIAEATLVANNIQTGFKTVNSELWDDTNDAQLCPIVTTSALGSFVVLISTANLTAGKIAFMVEYLLPANG